MKEVKRYYNVTKFKADIRVFVTDPEGIPMEWDTYDEANTIAVLFESNSTHGFSYMVAGSPAKRSFHNLSNIMEWYPDEQFLKVDGFDDAIIGVDEVNLKLIYSYARIMGILEEEGLTEEIAHEHFIFNIRGAYMGERTPIFCMDGY